MLRAFWTWLDGPQAKLESLAQWMEDKGVI